MTKDEAKLLVHGQQLAVCSGDDTEIYTFKYLDEDGDPVCYNKNGTPTPLAFDARDCEPVAPRTEKIDITPNWQFAMSVYISVLENGTAKGKREARADLMDLAKWVDSLPKEKVKHESTN